MDAWTFNVAPKSLPDSPWYPMIATRLQPETAASGLQKRNNEDNNSNNRHQNHRNKHANTWTHTGKPLRKSWTSGCPSAELPPKQNKINQNKIISVRIKKLAKIHWDWPALFKSFDWPALFKSFAAHWQAIAAQVRAGMLTQVASRNVRHRFLGLTTDGTLEVITPDKRRAWSGAAAKAIPRWARARCCHYPLGNQEKCPIGRYRLKFRMGIV